MIDTERTARRSRLLPRVGPPGIHPAVDLVAGQLAVHLVLAGEANTRPVTADDLIRWDTTLEELLPVALENLRRHSVQDGWYDVKNSPGLRVYMSQDGEAASRMLLIDTLLRPAPLGGVIVAIPGPDHLLAVSLDDMDALESMRVLATAADTVAAQSAEVLSDQLFWFDGHGWHLLAVKRDANEISVHPDAAFLGALERLAAVTYYAVAAEA